LNRFLLTLQSKTTSPDLVPYSFKGCVQNFRTGPRASLDRRYPLLVFIGGWFRVSAFSILSFSLARA
jgi:hypothetical protein